MSLPKKPQTQAQEIAKVTKLSVITCYALYISDMRRKYVRETE